MREVKLYMTDTYDRTAELEMLKLLFEKLSERLHPQRYCEMKVVIHEGRVVDSWIMDKAKSRKQLEAF